jgi:ATP-dependent protease ClpP protease subunit
MKKKWYSINGAKAALHDGIGQGDVQTVDAFLAELPAEGAIDLAIDSNGGSVAAGLRIYTALKDRDVTATVTGIAASMASVVLLIDRKIKEHADH